MSKLIELRDKHKTVLAQADALSKETDFETNADKSKEFDRMMDDGDKLATEIKAEEGREAANADRQKRLIEARKFADAAPPIPDANRSLRQEEENAAGRQTDEQKQYAAAF